jgi:hypothetical protein
MEKVTVRDQDVSLTLDIGVFRGVIDFILYHTREVVVFLKINVNFGTGLYKKYTTL